MIKYHIYQSFLLYYEVGFFTFKYYYYFYFIRTALLNILLIVDGFAPIIF